MDKVTAMAIDKGRKNTRLLVQPQYSPMPVEEQIAILYCGTHGLLKDITLEKVSDFETNYLRSLKLNHKEDVMEPLKKGVINDDMMKIMDEVAKETTNQVNA